MAATLELPVEWGTRAHHASHLPEGRHQWSQFLTSVRSCCFRYCGAHVGVSTPGAGDCSVPRRYRRLLPFPTRNCGPWKNSIHGYRASSRRARAADSEATRRAFSPPIVIRATAWPKTSKLSFTMASDFVITASVRPKSSSPHSTRQAWLPSPTLPQCNPSHRALEAAVDGPGPVFVAPVGTLVRPMASPSRGRSAPNIPVRSSSPAGLARGGPVGAAIVLGCDLAYMGHRVHRHSRKRRQRCLSAKAHGNPIDESRTEHGAERCARQLIGVASAAPALVFWRYLYHVRR